MRKFFLLSLIALISLSACKKDESISGDCEDRWGTIVFQSNTFNNYEVFIDNQSQGRVLGNMSISVKKPVGLYSLKAVQLDGFFGKPFEYIKAVEVKGCSKEFFIFPN